MHAPLTVYTAFWASRSGFALLCRVLRGAGELAAARGEINGTMPRPTPGEIGLAVLLVVGTYGSQVEVSLRDVVLSCTKLRRRQF